MDRRRLTQALATGLLLTLAGCGSEPSGQKSKGSGQHSSSASRLPHFGPPHTTAVPLGSRPVTRLPAADRTRVALTIDDGIDSDVVAGYARIAAETGLRLTFFGNGVYRSWAENRQRLSPLIESGQIVIGNHTWNHPDLTRLSSKEVAEQLTLNERHFTSLFGVTGRPFFRPPYGYYDRQVLSVASDLGYPAPILWYGNIGDDQPISSARVLANARKWFEGDHIVIGHANRPAVTHVFDSLVQLLHSRKLQPVTMADAFSA